MQRPVCNEMSWKRDWVPSQWRRCSLQIPDLPDSTDGRLPPTPVPISVGACVCAASQTGYRQLTPPSSDSRGCAEQKSHRLRKENIHRTTPNDQQLRPAPKLNVRKRCRSYVADPQGRRFVTFQTSELTFKRCNTTFLGITLFPC